jgi:hypothetical protein
MGFGASPDERAATRVAELVEDAKDLVPRGLVSRDRTLNSLPARFVPTLEI